MTWLRDLADKLAHAGGALDRADAIVSGMKFAADAIGRDTVTLLVAAAEQAVEHGTTEEQFITFARTFFQAMQRRRRKGPAGGK